MSALEGKIALVTGASRGIGRATALALAQAGADLFLAAEGTEEELADLAGECRKIRRGCVAHPGIFDLSKSEAATAMVAAAVKHFQRVDILVNNAGIRIRKPFGEFTAEDFDVLIAVNLRAPFLASQAVVPHMRAAGGGRIINLASQLGVVITPESSLYGISKAALIHMTRGMAIDLARDNISVNTVSPGPIETDYTQALMRKNPGMKEDRERLIPLGRWGTPEEVAEIIVFLSSTKATFIHGSNLVADGGYIIR